MVEKIKLEVVFENALVTLILDSELEARKKLSEYAQDRKIVEFKIIKLGVSHAFEF